jgi:hypothetical protein
MMRFSEFLAHRCAATWYVNIQRVQQEANDLLTSKGSINSPNWLIVKISNHITKCKLPSSVSDVLSEITKSGLVASFFAKDPKKQNISEKAQMDYLKQKLNRDVSKPSCLYIMADGKIERHVKHPPGATAKSIDFQSIDNSCGDECQEYYFAKVTEQGGGAQDNQWADVRSFIDGAKKNLEIIKSEKGDYSSGPKFIAIVDGHFYWNDGDTPTVKCSQLLKDAEGYETKIKVMSCDMAH